MDREILRALAGQVAELAHLDIQSHNMELHRAVNSLRMIRPVVLLDELPWNQLDQDGELTLKCEDEYLRTVEQEMRRTLYRWSHCRGDMIVEPFYRLNRAVTIGNIGVSIHEDILASDGDNNIVSHHYIDQLSDEASLEKLHPPEITVDDDLTEKRRALLDGVFGDMLPVRVTGVTHAGFYMPWDNLAMWRGVEPIYVDLMDDPELLHAFMGKFLEIRLDLMDRLEKMNLLDADLGILHCTPGLVDDLPGEIEGGRVTRKNLWGRGTAQVFASVSPAMHDEFEIEYAKRFFEGFGLVYYGCCEPLHNKIDIVKKLPNLRKISITPWADVRKAAERIGRDYVLSRKPNPASVAVPALDEDALRKDILETLSVCRENGTPVDITLKDISTVCYNPNNLTRWEQVVMETVRNF
jgi:hypothetical protein